MEQFEWKEVIPVKLSRSGKGLTDCITMSVDNKLGYSSVATISANLIKELNWEVGKKLKLYRNGTMFMLKPDYDGKFELKAPSKTSSSYRITGQSFCISIQQYTDKCKRFDAWTDLGQLLFKPAKE